MHIVHQPLTKRSTDSINTPILSQHSYVWSTADAHHSWRSSAGYRRPHNRLSGCQYPIPLRQRLSGRSPSVARPDSLKLIWDGPLRVQFKGSGQLNQELKIERLEIFKDDFSELVPRHSAKVALTTPPLSNRSTSPEAKRSPAERSVIGQVAHGATGGSDRRDETSISLPDSDINDIGIPKEVMVFLEVLTQIFGIPPYVI